MITKIFSSTVTNYPSVNTLPIHCQPATVDPLISPAVTFAEENISALSLLLRDNVSIKNAQNDIFLSGMQNLQSETEKLWQDGAIKEDAKTWLEQSSSTILNVKLFLIGFNLNNTWFEEAVVFEETVSTLIEHLKKHFQIPPVIQHVKFLQDLRDELLTNLELKETAQYHQSKCDQRRLRI